MAGGWLLLTLAHHLHPLIGRERLLALLCGSDCVLTVARNLLGYRPHGASGRRVGCSGHAGEAAQPVGEGLHEAGRLLGVHADLLLGRIVLHDPVDDCHLDRVLRQHRLDRDGDVRQDDAGTGNRNVRQLDGLAAHCGVGRGASALQAGATAAYSLEQRTATASAVRPRFWKLRAVSRLPHSWSAQDVPTLAPHPRAAAPTVEDPIHGAVG